MSYLVNVNVDKVFIFGENRNVERKRIKSTLSKVSTKLYVLGQEKRVTLLTRGYPKMFPGGVVKRNLDYKPAITMLGIVYDCESPLKVYLNKAESCVLYANFMYVPVYRFI